MAIAFDATNEATSSSASSLTYALTIASGGSLVVGTGSRDNFTGTQTVTYNGTSLTEYTGSGDTSRLFYLASPDTGSSYNVVVTFNGTGACSSIAVSLTGCDTSDLVGATQTASGGDANPTENITTDTDESWVVDIVTLGYTNASLTPGSGQTQRGSDLSPGANHTIGMSTEYKATAGVVTMSWSTPTQSWGVAAIEIHAAGGAPPATFVPKITIF